MNWFKKRISEPSTWAGLVGIVLGAGQAFKIEEAQPVAEAVGAVGQALAGGADPITAGIVGFAGLAAVFLGEKGRK
ncbi:MAG: hypothetical protein RLW87_08025 [Alphaproteobacteria bacterium]